MYKEIAANKRKTIFILLFFLLFIGGLSWLFARFMGNPSITLYVIIGALIYALISYFISSRMVLAMNGARSISKQDNPRLYRIVENLAITDGLPMPKVYIMDDPAPNAFATGRGPNSSSVAVTTGLMGMMEDNELEGVVAHELGHIKNYDIRVSMLAFALVAAVGLLADIIIRISWFGGGDDDEGGNQLFFIVGIVAAILAPIIAIMIQMAISRKREYLADATGALTTRYPEGLANALAKISQHGSAMKRQNTSTAHLFFANPLKKSSLAALFSTHPPIADRIARLNKMSSKK